MEFKKVVLSRKGLDLASGHGYSPFDPETGKYIVLPIPEGEIGGNIGKGTRFEGIKLLPNYLSGINVPNLRDLINHELLHYGSETKKEIREKYAHFDPWLGPCPWLTAQSNHHVGAFGQANAAQSHLANQGVGIGSLFLFFTRFKPIKGRHNKLGFNMDVNKGAYFLYGWLKVGTIAQKYKDIDNREIKQRHPHGAKHDFVDNDRKDRNTIYIADNLLFNGSSTPGCGYFPRLTKSLLLTSEERSETPSMWELPGFFFDSRPTYLKSRDWQRSADGLTCTVSSGGRGQEFVFEESKAFWQWFKNLLQKNLAP